MPDGVACDRVGVPADPAPQPTRGPDARRPGPDPAVAEVRRAVRAALAALPAAARTAPPLVACSGGADSLALLAAVLATRGADEPPVHAAVVDHGLQEGSGARAARLRRAAHRARCRRGRAPGRGHRARRAGGRGAPRPLRRPARRPPAPRLAGAPRPHPRRPGRDGAARARPRVRRALAGRDARVGPAVAAAVARGAPRGQPGGVRGTGPPRLGRPAQRRPEVHQGPAAPRGAPPAGGRARRRRRGRTGPHRGPAQGGRRRARRERRRAAGDRTRRRGPARGAARGRATRGAPAGVARVAPGGVGVRCSPTATCAPPTGSSPARRERPASPCRAGWSWSARMAGCSCARSDGHRPADPDPSAEEADPVYDGDIARRARHRGGDPGQDRRARRQDRERLRGDLRRQRPRVGPACSSACSRAL